MVVELDQLRHLDKAGFDRRFAWSDVSGVADLSVSGVAAKKQEHANSLVWY